MKSRLKPDHRALAESLRMRTLEGPGETEPALRKAVAACAAGEDGPGDATGQSPYYALARQIGEAAFRTTDAQVAEVVEATGSEKGGFEIILTAAVGAGLVRWQCGLRAVEGATDASA